MAIYFLDSWIASFIFLTCNDEVVDCHDLLKGKFRNDDLEAIRRLSRFAIRKDLQNAFFCK